MTGAGCLPIMSEPYVIGQASPLAGMDEQTDFKQHGCAGSTVAQDQTNNATDAPFVSYDNSTVEIEGFQHGDRLYCSSLPSWTTINSNSPYFLSHHPSGAENQISEHHDNPSLAPSSQYSASAPARATIANSDPHPNIDNGSSNSSNNNNNGGTYLTLLPFYSQFQEGLARYIEEQCPVVFGNNDTTAQDHSCLPRFDDCSSRSTQEFICNNCTFSFNNNSQHCCLPEFIGCPQLALAVRDMGDIDMRSVNNHNAVNVTTDGRPVEVLAPLIPPTFFGGVSGGTAACPTGDRQNEHRTTGTNLSKLELSSPADNSHEDDDEDEDEDEGENEDDSEKVSPQSCSEGNGTDTEIRVTQSPSPQFFYLPGLLNAEDLDLTHMSPFPLYPSGKSGVARSYHPGDTEGGTSVNPKIMSPSDTSIWDSQSSRDNKPLSPQYQNKDIYPINNPNSVSHNGSGRSSSKNNKSNSTSSKNKKKDHHNRGLQRPTVGKGRRNDKSQNGEKATKPPPEQNPQYSMVRKTVRNPSRDKLLLESKRAGLSYAEIKARFGFQEKESTLRGRYRTLTKTKEERVRNPQWTPLDILLLGEAAEKMYPKPTKYTKSWDLIRFSKKIPWKRVSDYIIANGGSYQFGNATCRKKWIQEYTLNGAIIPREQKYLQHYQVEADTNINIDIDHPQKQHFHQHQQQEQQLEGNNTNHSIDNNNDYCYHHHHYQNNNSNDNDNSSYNNIININDKNKKKKKTKSNNNYDDNREEVRMENGETEDRTGFN